MNQQPPQTAPPSGSNTTKPIRTRRRKDGGSELQPGQQDIYINHHQVDPRHNQQPPPETPKTPKEQTPYLPPDDPLWDVVARDHVFGKVPTPGGSVAKHWNGQVWQ